MRFLSALQLSILVACKAPVATPTDDTDPVGPPTDSDTDRPPLVDTGTTPGETGLPDCSGLAIDPVDPVVEAGGIQILVPSGGTGDYLWSVAPGGLGTVTDSGIYAAPPDATTETVVLADEGCDGSVSVDIDVVPPFVVLPVAAQVPPSSAVDIVVTGGSGSFECTLTAFASGGSLSGCDYTAGPAQGLDVVEVEDLQTGSVRQVVLTVTSDAALEPLGSVGWMLPLGSRFDPIVDGGSGRYTLEVAEPSVATAAYDADRDVSYLVGAGGGATTVTVRDTHVEALSWTGQLRVLQPFVPPAHHNGTFTVDPEAFTRDLDGDGFPELVLGAREASVSANEGGYVGIYAGTASGADLASGPVFELVGDHDEGHLGKAVAFGDLDGDGFEDLVVGAPGTPWIFNTAGEVTVHAGDGTGAFDTEPFVRLNGVGSGARFGEGVGVCDVDGDGLDDLIASDLDSDDATDTSRPGSLRVYLQGATGLSTNAIVRYGVRQVGADWVPVENGRLGEYGFAVGDFDHDGLCDVAAAIDSRDWATDASGPGFVLVWGGDAASGLTTDPVRVIEPGGGDTGVRFGRYLTVGQVDGSAGPAGLPDDLLIGARGYDGAAGTTSSTGGAFLYLGGPGAPAQQDLADVDWSITGVGGNDLVGEGLGIGVSGDLLVAVRGEHRALRIPGGTSFVAGSFDIDTLPVGAISLEPAEGDGEDASLLGFALAENGDGLFGYTRYDHQLPNGSWEAVDARGLHTIAADGTTTTWLLGSPSGQQYGRGALLHDIDGNGSLDVVVGGNEAGNPLFGGVSGMVQGWTGAAWTSLGDDPPTGSTSDRRGWDLARSDLDGSGSVDLVMVARTDSRPDDPGLDVACVGATGRSSTGHLAVHLTRGGALGAKPDQIWWPPENSARPEAVAGGFDADGDGFEDLVIGLSDDTVSLVYGQAAPPVGQTHELCREERFSVAEASTDFGFSVAALGDLDGDGCDEIAIGAPREDLGLSDQGIIRVLWGYAATGCARTGPELSVLADGIVSRRLGMSLAGGVDVTGDGVPDLAVGGNIRSVGGDRVGDALLVDGAYLAGLAATSLPAVGGVAPDSTVPMLQPGTFGVTSWTPSSDFGRSIALVAGTGGDRWLAVGMPDANQLSRTRSGGVTVYRVSGGVIEPEPAWWIGGESFRGDSDFGFALSVADERLVIGAPGSSALSRVHVGGAYVAPL